MFGVRSRPSPGDTSSLQLPLGVLETGPQAPPGINAQGCSCPFRRGLGPTAPPSAGFRPAPGDRGPRATWLCAQFHSGTMTRSVCAQCGRSFLFRTLSLPGPAEPGGQAVPHLALATRAVPWPSRRPQSSRPFLGRLCGARPPLAATAEPHPGDQCTEPRSRPCPPPKATAAPASSCPPP